jgi:ferrochelatase
VSAYDAVVVVSFGGPEGPDDVLPFMENVTRGRGIPRERLVEVSAHYQRFGGVSPINAQNRALIAALEPALAARGIDLPVYWGNRNWHPMLPDTVQRMADDGVRRALAFVTSVFGSYSGCRQYRDDIDRARDTVGAAAPLIDKLRLGWNHPGFLEAMTDRVRAALDELPPGQRGDAELVFCAHSVPTAMALPREQGGSPYLAQLHAAMAIVAGTAAPQLRAELVFQSRSGPPGQPWLEPDVNDHLRDRFAAGTRAAVLIPIGFVSDHMEVVYDLDTQAMETAAELGMTVVRAGTVGTHRRFVDAIVDLVAERLDDRPLAQRAAWPGTAPWPDGCEPGCCPAPQRPPTAGRPG